jgi:hypothetical protein
MAPASRGARALLLAAAACLTTVARAQQQLAPDDATLDKRSFLSGPPLPPVGSTLELDGFSQLPVPWARGADPAFTFVRTRGAQLVTGEGAASSPHYHVGASCAAYACPILPHCNRGCLRLLRLPTDAHQNASHLLAGAGANLWHGMHLGAASGPTSDRARLLRDLDALAKAGVTHVRILGASEGPDSEPWRVSPSLQPCPGVYNAQARAAAWRKRSARLFHTSAALTSCTAPRAGRCSTASTSWCISWASAACAQQVRAAVQHLLLCLFSALPSAARLFNASNVG